MSTVIKVENLSKRYRLGLIGSGTLREDLEGWWYRIRGKEDPTLAIAEENDRTKVGNTNYVWALRDINFEVQQGEVLGIIGKNGAGKSTLLKLLSRVTAPTTGLIKAKGRIASLLEVGTGFHPELTGRENIFLNGAVMGMKRPEIIRKFDEIVDFAGVERYIDTPVKRYSSGMYVRLAFAVAAHLEPEILIVDEVLAVGDAEFQKKALGKMKEVSSGGGRTVLFVSHNMASVKTLCERAILLEKGGVALIDRTDKVISTYLSGSANSLSVSNKRTFGSDLSTNGVSVESIELSNVGGTVEDPLVEDCEIEITTTLRFKDVDPSRYHLTFHLNNDAGEGLFSFSSAHSSELEMRANSTNKLVCRFPAMFFQSGEFYLHLFLVQDRRASVLVEKDAIRFIVVDRAREIGSYMGREPGHIRPRFQWLNKVPENA